MSKFIKRIDQNNSLKSLHIGYNSLRELKTGTIQNKNLVAKDDSESFESILCAYMHYSPFLLHLDMSYTELSFESLIQIVYKGIRKSRTMLSIHLNGIGLIAGQLQKFKEAMNDPSGETFGKFDMDTWTKISKLEKPSNTHRVNLVSS